MKKPTKTQRALLIPCPVCGSEAGVPCTLVFLTELDPKRSERHAMKRMHTERYIESVNLKVPTEETVPTQQELINARVAQFKKDAGSPWSDN